MIELSKLTEIELLQLLKEFVEQWTTVTREEQNAI